MSRKIAFTSLGCDKNRVDSEVMLGILQKNGYTAVADEAEADIIVFIVFQKQIYSGITAGAVKG